MTCFSPQKEDGGDSCLKRHHLFPLVPLICLGSLLVEGNEKTRGAEVNPIHSQGSSRAYLSQAYTVMANPQTHM